jgi:hypothetical protein
VPTPQEFLTRVVAWPGPDGPGYVNIHWLSSKYPGMPGRAFKEPAEANGFVEWTKGYPADMSDIYFCLSTQSENGGLTKGGKMKAARGVPGAMRLKAIWLDIDGNKPNEPEKGYPTKDAAFTALVAFLKSTAIRPPTVIVDSGNGYHVYWVSKDPLTVEEWRPYAQGLYNLTKAHGLKCDPVTTDAARVLRVPGTFNRKDKANAKQVAIKGWDPQDLDFGTALALLPPLAGPITAAVTPLVGTLDLSKFPKVAAFAHLDCTDSLSAGLHDDRPIAIDELVKQCGHFKDCATNKGAGQGQGLWALTLMACTFLEDGERWAHYFSKGYPTYDKDETQKKYEEKIRYKQGRDLGWPSCVKFEGEGAKACATCPLKGTIRSPLNIARKAAAPTAVGAVATLLGLPKGFTIDPDTGIVCVVAKKTVGKDITTYNLPLFHGQITEPRAQGGTASGICFYYKTPHEIRPVKVKDEDLGGDQSLAKSLSKQSCRVNTPAEKYVRHFMVSYVAILEAAKKRHNAQSMGWFYEDGAEAGFSYAGDTHLKNGQTTYAGIDDVAFSVDYTPIGKPGVVEDLLKIICDQHHPALEVLAASGFASPLMFVPGEDSTVVWGYSEEAGAHKSTSILTGAGIWAHPKRVKDNSSASILGIQGKLGKVRNLPYYLDELGDVKQVEAVAKTLNMITEGKTGSKSTRSGDSRAVFDWQLLLTCGSNKSLRDFIVKEDADTDARLQRVFEFVVEKRGDTNTNTKLLTEALNHNFGHVGVRYAQYLGRNVDKIRILGKQVVDEFSAAVDYKSPERYWRAACVTTILGAMLANKLFEDTIFHVDEIKEFLIEKYKDQRNFVMKTINYEGAAYTTELRLTHFIKSSVNNQLWTKEMRMGRGNHSPLTALHAPPPGRPDPIHVHWFVDAQCVYISHQRFKEFCEEHDYTPQTTITNLLKVFHGSIMDRVSLTAHVPRVSTGGPEKVIVIQIDQHSPLWEALNAWNDPLDPASVGAAPVGDPLTAAVTQGAKDLEVVKNALGEGEGI